MPFFAVLTIAVFAAVQSTGVVRIFVGPKGYVALQFAKPDLPIYYTYFSHETAEFQVRLHNPGTQQVVLDVDPDAIPSRLNVVAERESPSGGWEPFQFSSQLQSVTLRGSMGEEPLLSNGTKAVPLRPREALVTTWAARVDSWPIGRYRVRAHPSISCQEGCELVQQSELRLEVRRVTSREERLEMHLRQAVDAMDRSDVAEFESAIGRLLDEYPQSAVAYGLRARFAESLGLFDVAAAHFGRAAELIRSRADHMLIEKKGIGRAAQLAREYEELAKPRGRRQ